MQVVVVAVVLMRVKPMEVPVVEVEGDPTFLFQLPVQLTQVVVVEATALATAAGLADPALLLLDIQVLSQQLYQPQVVQL
jgi:hypothetical protein